MGTGILADSTLLIDYLNGVRQAELELRGHEDRAVSVISWIEVMAGMQPGEQDRAEALLRNFVLLQLTAPIARRAAQIRRESRLKLPDAVILATAHVENRILLTRNTRDFSPGPFVRIPYQL